MRGAGLCTAGLNRGKDKNGDWDASRGAASRSPARNSSKATHPSPFKSMALARLSQSSSRASSNAFFCRKSTFVPTPNAPSPSQCTAEATAATGASRPGSYVCCTRMALDARAHLLSRAAAGMPRRCNANRTDRCAARYSTTAASSSTTNAATEWRIGAFTGSTRSSSSTVPSAAVGRLPKAAPNQPAAPNRATCGRRLLFRMSSLKRTRSCGGVACKARSKSAPCFGDTSSALSKNWSCASAVASRSKSGRGRIFVASSTRPTPGASGSSSRVAPSAGVLPSQEPTIRKAARAGTLALPLNEACKAPRTCSASAKDKTT